MDKKIGVGVGVMLLRDGRVLLGRRHEDAVKASSELKGAGQWTMPGGKLDFGESFEDGARRETREETGLELGEVDVLCINNDVIDTAHYVTIGLIATEFEGEPRVLEPDKITTWEWFELDKLPEPMYAPSERVVQNYLQGAFYISHRTQT